MTVRVSAWVYGSGRVQSDRYRRLVFCALNLRLQSRAACKLIRSIRVVSGCTFIREPLERRWVKIEDWHSYGMSDRLACYKSKRAALSSQKVTGNVPNLNISDQSFTCSCTSGVVCIISPFWQIDRVQPLSLITLCSCNCLNRQVWSPSFF